MREKAEQGIYPSRPPLGYRNNKIEHTIELDPPNVPIAKRIFELYATGKYSLASLRKAIQKQNLGERCRRATYISCYEIRFTTDSLGGTGTNTGAHIRCLLTRQSSNKPRKS